MPIKIPDRQSRKLAYQWPLWISPATSRNACHLTSSTVHIPVHGPVKSPELSLYNPLKIRDKHWWQGDRQRRLLTSRRHIHMHSTWWIQTSVNFRIQNFMIREESYPSIYTLDRAEVSCLLVSQLLCNWFGSTSWWWSQTVTFTSQSV